MPLNAIRGSDFHSVPQSTRASGPTTNLEARVRRFCARKRVLDSIVVLVVSPAVFAVVILAGAAVLISMGRPLFFYQVRIGRYSEPFVILKLRTMTVTKDSAPLATEVQDARVTRLGRFLRRYRIDELPQFVNVLRGEMSIIGPRPEQPQLVEKYQKVLPGYDDRHLVRPGITGWAQVKCGYASTVEETRMKLTYDREYVSRASLAFDSLIAVLTIKTLMLGVGVR